jgi:ABC-type Na+ efflux pump permease subunit
MGYFWGMIKKEFIEIRYSYKNIFFIGIMFAVLFYIAQTEIEFLNNTENMFYIVTFIVSMAIPSQFISESIFSDKRNQTFERYFVSGNIKTIMFAKYFGISILFIIPFIAFYVYFLLNGINVIESVYVLFNTPLYYWIGLCSITIASFIFNDEKALSLSCLPCLLLVIGIIQLNHYVGTIFHPIFTCLISVLCTFVFTLLAYRFFKNTKYFLKI